MRVGGVFFYFLFFLSGLKRKKMNKIKDEAPTMIHRI